MKIAIALMMLLTATTTNAVTVSKQFSGTLNSNPDALNGTFSGDPGDDGILTETDEGFTFTATAIAWDELAWDERHVSGFSYDPLTPDRFSMNWASVDPEFHEGFYPAAWVPQSNRLVMEDTVQLFAGNWINGPEWPLQLHSFTLTDNVPDPTTITWNQLGPGTFSYDTAANWTPNQTPTASTDVFFPLAGDVDVVPFSTSVANNVTFSDGTVRLKSLGTTTFTSHGNVTVDDQLAANLAGGAFATLDGTNGHTWTTSFDLKVGNAGFGTFAVNNGADFDAQQILVGNQAGAEGEVTVTGSGSTITATLNTDASLYRIGSAGGTGTLNVRAGATVTSGSAGDVSLGEGLGATGTFNIDGPGSNALINDLRVGLGGVGFMNITGGGLVDQTVGADPDAQVAAADLSANIGAGTVVVNGDDSRWNFKQGEFGAAGVGDVSVEVGGRIASTADVTVGLNSTSQGSLHVTGSGTLVDSLVSVGANLTIGEIGQAALTVDLGGDVTVGDDMFIGGDPSNLNSNVVTITNPGSSLIVANFLEVGSAGRGTLNITDGATVSSSRKLIAGALPDSTGNITLNGTNSSATTIDTLIGEQGMGSLTISGGAHLQTARLWAGQYDNSAGTVNIQGTGSTLAISSDPVINLRIGGHWDIGGGTGTVTVSEGGTIISNNEVHIGDEPSAVGSLTVTGSTSLADFNDSATTSVTAVGHSGEGMLSIFDGGRVESKLATIGHLAGANGKVDVGNGNAMANWNVGGSLSVGGSASTAGGTGLLNIHSQGTVTVAGDLKIWDDGAVFLNSPAATLSVGSITFTAGSQFVFEKGNLVLTGSGLDIHPGGTLGDSVNLFPGQTLSTTGGGMVNDGDLNIIGTAASFAGGPSVNNDGAAVNAINATLTFDGDLTNNGDINLINSTVNGSLINGGTGALAMIGANSFSDDLQFGAQDHVYVDFSGSAPGEFDTLIVGGEANLHGSLTVDLAGGFAPSAGDTFDILTAAGGIIGAFDGESLPALAGDLQWFVNYSPTALTLVATLAADFNEDGNVNGDDLAAWKGGFGSLDATHMQGDADGDGDADGADYFIWQRQFGSGLLPASLNDTRAVPEPCTQLLGVMAVAGLLMRRW